MLIRGHDLEVHTVEQFDELHNIYGITGYQLALKKSFALNERILTEESVAKINNSVFKHSPILGAYFNPVHPDYQIVREGIENFIFNMNLASKFGIKYVGTETGSVLGTPWNYHPDNHKSATVEQLIEVFKEIANRTKEVDVKIAIEPAYQHVIKDVDSLLEMDREIGNDRIVYILDIFNLLKSRNYEDYKLILENFLDKAGSKTKIIHLKDFVVENNQVKQVKIGEGIVDFEYLIQYVKRVTTNAEFVLEGTFETDLLDVTEHVAKYILD